MNLYKIFTIILILTGASVPLLAEDNTYPGPGITDNWPLTLPESLDIELGDSEDQWLIFPGFELGSGSGSLSAAASLNIGYRWGEFVVGTSLKWQIVNLDRTNYVFTPVVINIGGLSYTIVPSTSNQRNNKRLRGHYIGYGEKIKFTFGLLTESDPATNDISEFLTLNIGLGF